MRTSNNDSEKEIEFRVYSNGEYIDIFKFHPVIGEKIWQALMDIAITGDLTDSASMSVTMPGSVMSSMTSGSAHRSMPISVPRRKQPSRKPSSL